MRGLDYKIDMSSDSEWKVITASAPARNNLLYLQEAGRFKSGEKYYTERYGLDSYLLTLTLGGRGMLEYCGKEYELRKGDFFLIDCKREQRYRTAKDAGTWDTLWVHINGKSAEYLYESFLSENDGGAVAHTDGTELAKLLEDLLWLGKHYGAGFEDDIRANGLIGMLFSCAVSCAGMTQSPVCPTYIAECKRLMQQRLAEPLSLDTLSAELSVSKFHLQRTFKAFTGYSPCEYLSVLRINHAKELLRGTKLPISQVAETVGMDSSYFVRTFRVTEGVTPGKYRKLW